MKTWQAKRCEEYWSESTVLGPTEFQALLPCPHPAAQFHRCLKGSLLVTMDGAMDGYGRLWNTNSPDMFQDDTKWLWRHYRTLGYSAQKQKKMVHNASPVQPGLSHQTSRWCGCLWLAPFRHNLPRTPLRIEAPHPRRPAAGVVAQKIAATELGKIISTKMKMFQDVPMPSKWLPYGTSQCQKISHEDFWGKPGWNPPAHRPGQFSPARSRRPPPRRGNPSEKDREMVGFPDLC